ncbi:hypothetical protein DKY64_22495, partial [Stenotrophomonas maltophilia]
MLPATVAGALATRSARLRVGSLLCMVALFAVTLTFHRENPGSELCMRSPFAFVALGFVARAASELVRGLEVRVGARAAYVAACGI